MTAAVRAGRRGPGARALGGFARRFGTHGLTGRRRSCFMQLLINRDVKCNADQLDRTFAALADPTRRSILARLAEGEATVNELAEPFPVSLPAISRHLKVLERAGLIERGREAQWRPSRLQPEPLNEAAAWLQERRRTWETRMDRLDAHLRRTEARHR